MGVEGLGKNRDELMAQNGERKGDASSNSYGGSAIRRSRSDTNCRSLLKVSFRRKWIEVREVHPDACLLLGGPKGVTVAYSERTPLLLG